jgi:adenylate cyclase
MDRIWQWAWDRYGPRYSWAVFGISSAALLSVYLIYASSIVAFERSDRYAMAAAVCLVTVLVMAYFSVLPGLGAGRLVERWAAGCAVDRRRALEATYVWTRRVRVLGPLAQTVVAATQFFVVSAVAGAPGSRSVQYAILGAAAGLAVSLIGVHSMPESGARPARIALTAGTALGEELPRSRPAFATWANVLVVATAFGFSATGAMLAVVIGRVREYPGLVAMIGAVLAFGFAMPITVTTSFAPLLRPVRDLARGTERVAAGDYTQTPACGPRRRSRGAGSFVQPHAGGFG